ncbi:MAG: hypothetical protein ACLFPN_03320 [Methanomassiliicoccales archaeon]
MADIRATMFIGPLLHSLVGVVDTDLFFRRFRREGRLVDLCLGISRGDERWTSLLRELIPRFPRLFFSSLS